MGHATCYQHGGTCALAESVVQRSWRSMVPSARSLRPPTLGRPLSYMSELSTLTTEYRRCIVIDQRQVAQGIGTCGANRVEQLMLLSSQMQVLFFLAAELTSRSGSKTPNCTFLTFFTYG